MTGLPDEVPLALLMCAMRSGDQLGRPLPSLHSVITSMPIVYSGTKVSLVGGGVKSMALSSQSGRTSGLSSFCFGERQCHRMARGTKSLNCA